WPPAVAIAKWSGDRWDTTRKNWTTSRSLLDRARDVRNFSIARRRVAFCQLSGEAVVDFAQPVRFHATWAALRPFSGRHFIIAKLYAIMNCVRCFGTGLFSVAFLHFGTCALCFLDGPPTIKKRG